MRGWLVVTGSGDDVKYKKGPSYSTATYWRFQAHKLPKLSAISPLLVVASFLCPSWLIATEATYTIIPCKRLVNAPIHNTLHTT